MPEETKTEEIPLVLDSVPSELEVARFKDETDKSGKPWKFVQAKLKKKNAADADRFALVPVKPKTQEDFEKFLAFLGVEQAALLSYQRARGMAANWTESSVNKAGQFLQGDFVKCVEEFSARGETIKVLNEERIELTNEIIELSKNGGTMDAVQFAKRVNEIGARLNIIKETIDARQKTNPEDAELEGVEQTPANA